MPYSPTDWVDGVTPVDAAHMDKMEAGILASEEKAAKGAANGYAALDGRGGVIESQMPYRLFQTTPWNVPTDLNNEMQSGWCHCNASTLNGPTASDYYIQTIAFGADYVFQQAIGFWDGTTYRRFKRATWTAWEVTHPLPLRIGPTSEQLGDANLATKTGFYNVYAGATNNTPDTAMHWFIYVNTVTPDYCHQFATALYDNRMYTRRGGAGGWGGWTKVHPIDDTNLPGRLQTATSSNRISDCNLARNSGWYGVEAGTNTPGPTIGYLEVINWDTPGGVTMQTFHAFDSPAIWKRFMWGSWSGWYPVMTAGGYVPNSALPPRLAPITPSPTVDFNTLIETGFYNVYIGSNGPPSAAGHMHVIVQHWDYSHITQTAVELFTGDEWRRAMNAGVWRPWGKVYPPSSSGGVKVVTSLVGLTETDGAAVWLKGGDSRKLFVFDATLGRWISESWIARAWEGEISNNTTVSTVWGRFFPVCEDYYVWHGAGARLQIRPIWSWSNDQASAGVVDFTLWGGNQGDSVNMGGYYAIMDAGGYNEPYTTAQIWAASSDAVATEWRNVDENLGGYHMVSGQFGVRSNAAPDNTTTRVQNMHVVARLASY
jgi:hypothetical protein